MGGSRVLFSMSKARMLPGILAKLHSKYNTPYISILFLGSLSMIAPFFGRVMLVWIVDAANFACCLAYCIVALSFVKLRKSRPDIKRPFHVSNGLLVGTLGIYDGWFYGYYVCDTRNKLLFCMAGMGYCRRMVSYRCSTCIKSCKDVW